MKLVISKEDIKEKADRLYLIEFEDDTGYYVKCGKSSGKDSEKRLITIMESYIRAHHGNCAYARILRDVQVDNVFTKESKFHTKFKDRRHYPKHSFSGYTELFALTKEEAINAFDAIVQDIEDTHPTKTCYTCKQVKATKDFGTNNSKPDKLNHECKECNSIRLKSFDLLPYRMFNNQVQHSKDRNHPRPQYTYEEFKAWLLKQEKYKDLYEDYKNSGYDKDKVPSVDRIDPSKPYSFDNIRLMTFRENYLLNVEITTTAASKPLLVYALDGSFVGEFSSRSNAGRVLQISSKTLHCSIDTVTKYGWLAREGNYHFISKENKNKFTSNNSIKEEFRYKGKVKEVYDEMVKDRKKHKN